MALFVAGKTVPFFALLLIGVFCDGGVTLALLELSIREGPIGSSVHCIRIDWNL